MLVLISLDLKMTNSVSLEGATSDEGANDDLGIVDVTVALIENRAKEIGMAVFDGTHVSLRLLQFIGDESNVFLAASSGLRDVPYVHGQHSHCKLSAESSRTYNSSLSILRAYEPAQLIVVGSSQEVLSSGINKATRGFHQVPLARVRPFS